MVRTGRSKGRIAAALVAQAALCAAVAAAGYWAGHRAALQPLRKHLATFRIGTTLGQVLPPEQRDGAARAYLDPDAARAGFDTFSWTVPNTPTPFVGDGPHPGPSANAQINAWQCRTAQPVRTPKPKDTYRVFMTGGSTLYGSGAPSDAHTVAGFLAARLQRELAPATGRAFEVFPLGNPAWASTHERIAIENRISELEPDLVISLSGMNDINWGSLGRNVLWFRSYVDQIWFELLNAVLHQTGFAPMLDIAGPEPVPIAADVVATRLEKNVRLAAHALALHGARYVFALQPALPVTQKPLSARELAYARPQAETDYWASCAAQVRARLGAADLANFAFADLTALFDDLGAGDEVFLDTLHFGDRGNQRIADAIFAAIEPLLR